MKLNLCVRRSVLIFQAKITRKPAPEINWESLLGKLDENFKDVVKIAGIDAAIPLPKLNEESISKLVPSVRNLSVPSGLVASLLPAFQLGTFEFSYLRCQGDADAVQKMGKIVPDLSKFSNELVLLLGISPQLERLLWKISASRESFQNLSPDALEKQPIVMATQILKKLNGVAKVTGIK